VVSNIKQSFACVACSKLSLASLEGLSNSILESESHLEFLHRSDFVQNVS
jgi:hypothetical protein